MGHGADGEGRGGRRSASCDAARQPAPGRDRSRFGPLLHRRNQASRLRVRLKGRAMPRPYNSLEAVPIEGVSALEILDSRGNPTLAVTVETPYGFGRALVPSGPARSAGRGTPSVREVVSLMRRRDTAALRKTYGIETVESVGMSNGFAGGTGLDTGQSRDLHLRTGRAGDQRWLVCRKRH